MTNPFEPIDGGKKHLRVVAQSDRAVVAPIPADAPAAPAKHPKLGKPSQTWAYRDAGRGTLGFICRFDGKAGKEFRPLVLWRDKEGALEWRWQAWSDPRPLYGLDRLAAQPAALVLCCEGEKAADAAELLAPGYVAVTSPNGAKSAGKADWRPLRGRHVIIWPDHDEAGAQYAETVARACVAAGAASVAIISPPTDMAAGWDAADALSQGWTAERATNLIDGAKPFFANSKPGKSGETNGGGRRRPPQRDGLIGLTDGCEFWHGPDGEAYVTFPVKSHRENWPVRSKRFRTWLTGQAYTQQQTVPGSQALEDALRFLEGRALNDGPEKKPWKRVGATNDGWYLDLCDETWRVVEISGDGWRIIDGRNLPFIRSPSMRPLPEPVQGELIESLRRFVNVSSEADFMSIVSWLLAAIHHRGEYPVLVVQGEQGSGKSTFSRMLREIVDPNVAPIRSAPKDEEDLIVSAANAHVLAFDNISKIEPAMSDALCRVATGGGFATRTHYSNTEESVFWVCAPIMLNGIPALAERPDLARRALVIHLCAIPNDERQAEDDVWSDWVKAAPGVLGALLDGLSTAFRRLPTTKLARSSSMAYFEKLVEAASPALGWEPGQFAEVYKSNQSDLQGAAFEADPVAMAIADLIAEDYPRGWAGTATRLLDLLTGRVSEGMKKSLQWPKTAQGLGNRIERVKPLLRDRGIIIERKHSGERTITIVPKRDE